MTQWLAIATGGALGALLRFGVSTGVHSLLGRGFPYGTLTVNFSGCLLMGWLYVVLLERSLLGAEWRAALLIGVLGAFTTFSTFSIETLLLVEEGELAKALLNVGASVAVCIGATWVGLQVGRGW